MAKRRKRSGRNPHLKLLVLDRLFLLLRTAVKTAAACYGIYAGHGLIESLANGKIDWNTVLLAILRGDMARMLLSLIAIVAVVVAISERRLRKILIADRAPYIKSLEERIDVRRSSSKLSPDGSTRQEDLDGN